MSALPDTRSRLRPMFLDDLERVVEIERAIYEFPWTRGNFLDSLNSGYLCRVFEARDAMLGYGVLMQGAGEAHLLNLSIAAGWQGRGWGSRLLEHFVGLAIEGGNQALLLEVRPTNTIGRALYARRGFAQIAVRPRYYPAKGGREDALLLRLVL